MAYGFKDNKCKTPVYSYDDLIFENRESVNQAGGWEFEYPEGLDYTNIDIVAIKIYRWDDRAGFQRELTPIELNYILLGTDSFHVEALGVANEITVVIRKKVF